MANLFLAALVTVFLFPLQPAFGKKAAATAPVHQWVTQEKEWLNTTRPLKAEDLKGRLLLLDFWTYCCINCMHVIPDLKILEKEFGSDLTVLGVHSAKFANEKDSENIRAAILKYGIEHPVVNDADFKIWNSFNVSGWPTLVLIDPEGTIAKTYSGEGNLALLRSDITQLRAQYKGRINHSVLPIALEKKRTRPSLLSFPGKLVYVPDFDGEPILFVSDSNHNRVVGVRLSGKIAVTVGNGRRGHEDGGFELARFDRPQGLLYRERILFVADTENHLLRQINFSTRKVETLAGTGRQGNERAVKDEPALQTALSSPWDLAFYPTADEIAIATAGSHQIWSYHLKQKTVTVLAGTGVESIDDGPYPTGTLSQPSGLAIFDGKLYFVDSETSSLRVLEKGAVHTLIGTGLFKFGFHDGKQGEALMQHPIGVFADATGVYVADTYNHAIRRYDPATGQLSTYAGVGRRGNEDGKAINARFNEPNAITRGKEGFFIADTNNSMLRRLDPATLNVSTMTLETAEAKSLASRPVKRTHALSNSLPNLQKDPPLTVAASVEVPVTLDLEKEWQLNGKAPSWMAVFKMKGTAGKTIKEFAKDELATKPLKLPALSAGEYRLQGSFYFCKEGAGALCVIQSHDMTLNVSSGADAAAQSIEIKLRP